MNRHGNKWSINEVLTLQRQYELLDLTVKQIAKLHKRTEDSICYKIESEGFNCKLDGKKRRKELTGMKLRNGKYKN